MNERAIEVLRSIVEEVDPKGPFSSDSYLPAHLIHDARDVIEQHECCHDQAIARRQQEVQM